VSLALVAVSYYFFFMRKGKPAAAASAVQKEAVEVKE